MSIIKKKAIRLVFSSGNGSTFVLHLQTPKNNVMPAEIEQAMDIVLEKQIFDLPGGDLIAKRDAKIIETSTEDVFDPPVV